MLVYTALVCPAGGDTASAVSATSPPSRPLAAGSSRMRNGGAGTCDDTRSVTGPMLRSHVRGRVQNPAKCHGAGDRQRPTTHPHPHPTGRECTARAVWFDASCGYTKDDDWVQEGAGKREINSARVEV